MKASQKRKYGKAIIRSIRVRRFVRQRVWWCRIVNVCSTILYKLAQLAQFCAIGALLIIAFISLFGLWPQFNGYMYDVSSGMNAKPLFEMSLGTKFFLSWLIANIDPLSRFFLLASPVALLILIAMFGLWVVDRLSRIFQASFEVTRSVADEVMAAILWALVLIATWFAFDPHIAFVPMLAITLAMVANVGLYVLSYAIRPKLKVPKWRIIK